MHGRFGRMESGRYVDTQVEKDCTSRVRLEMASACMQGPRRNEDQPGPATGWNVGVCSRTAVRARVARAYLGQVLSLPTDPVGPGMAAGPPAMPCHVPRLASRVVVRLAHA